MVPRMENSTMSFRKTLLAATILAAGATALPLAAQAQPVAGLYVAAGAGVNWRSDLNINSVFGNPTVNPERFNIRMNPGWVALGSVGWGFGNGLRLEGEVNYRINDPRKGTFQFPGGAVQRLTGMSGNASTYGVMANVLYDIGSTMGWPVHITLGAGVGYAWSNFDNIGGNDGTIVRFNQTSGNFAYQGIAGLSVPIPAVPGLAITAEYRYFAMLDTDHRGTFNNGAATLPQNARNVNNENHSALIGVRYNFGQAPRVVRAPDRVVDPARSFLVFFDFDRADLTPRAREIIGQAAQASRSQQTTRVEVAGHADRSGTPQYNQGLSQRRANNTAAELVRLGVPRGAISVAAFGESRPLVPTADGVREPQNRRVEIVLR